MSFTYRENQNTPLTWAQLDGNFREVENVQREVSTQVMAAAASAESAAAASDASQSSAELAEEMARISVVRWCGNSTTPPTTRLDGSPLEISDEYGNLTDNLRYNWTGSVWVALNSSAQQLEVSLAAPTGAGLSGYSRHVLPPTITTVAHMFDSDSVNVREKRFTDLITDRPDPNDYRTWDWSPAIQGAVDYVYNIADTTRRINALPSIILPGAVYKLKKMITTWPWVKIRSVGTVTLDFSSAPADVSAFWIQNKLNWTQTEPNVSVSGALSPCIDGSGGVMYIRGQGFSTSTAPMFKIGNDVDGFDPSRDIQICNVFGNRWMVAADFNGFDTFLCTFRSCRLEYNKYNIRLPLAPYNNSGERVQFENCTLAGALASVLLRGPAFDLHFIGCSFDFNTDVFLIDGGTYCSINCTNCHFEGWDGALVNSVTAGGWVFINIANATILPSGYLVTDNYGFNGAGRPLFITQGSGTPGQGVQINVTNPRIGIVAKCYSEQPFISTGNGSVNVTGATIYESNFAGNAQAQGVRDWQFQTDADGTLASALSLWTVDNLNLIDSPNSKLTTVNGKKVLQMKATGAASTSYFRLTSKDRTPVQPGQYVFAWCAASLEGTTGSVSLQPNVAFYDSLGNVMPFPTLFASYLMRDAFNDTKFPNFAQGDTRYMATEPGVYRAPPGAVSVAFRSMFTVFGGTLNVSRASVCVSH